MSWTYHEDVAPLEKRVAELEHEKVALQKKLDKAEALLDDVLVDVEIGTFRYVVKKIRNYFGEK